MAQKIIYLIGPMGAGKSTIGRLLAKKLDLPFVDTDRKIEDRSGVSISWIFDKEGEEGFRQRETAVLTDLVNMDIGQVIATGGGTVLFPENRKLMLETGFIVFLETSVDVQAERTRKDKRRPLLQNTDNRYQVLKDVYSERKKWYEELAHLTVNTDDGSPVKVINQIVEALDL